jgi:hypothetical protein
MASQKHEHVELLGGQVQFSTAHRYGSPREINLEISAFNDPLRGSVWMVSDPLECIMIGPGQ